MTLYECIIYGRICLLFLIAFFPSTECAQNLFKASLKRFAKSLFELYASDPALKIEQFPDFKLNAATSAVTLGLLS